MICFQTINNVSQVTVPRDRTVVGQSSRSQRSSAFFLRYLYSDFQGEIPKPQFQDSGISVCIWNRAGCFLVIEQSAETNPSASPGLSGLPVNKLLLAACSSRRYQNDERNKKYDVFRANCFDGSSVDVSVESRSGI